MYFNEKMLEEKDAEIGKLNSKIIELQNQQSKFENQKLKEVASRLELEIRQYKERVAMMRESEEKTTRENQKYTTEIIQERIKCVQQLQVELSGKENELIMLSKKVKNLNYTVQLYKEQAEKFNKKK